MKLVNLLLCVFIFIMAVASAGFSYLLFEKRNELLAGWSLLAQSVSQTAQSLDEGSGSKLAETLKEEMLGHENFSDLENNIKLLPEHAKKVISQRDALAKVIVRIPETFEIEDKIDLAELKELEKSPAGCEKIIGIISGIKERNDKTRNMIKDHAEKVGVAIDTENLKSNPGGELNKLGSKLEAIKTRMNKYNTSLQSIASTAGAPSVDLRSSDYASSLSSIQSAVQKLKKDYTSTKQQLAANAQKVQNLTGSMTSKDKVIAQKDKDIKNKNEEIIKLKGMIGIGGGGKLDDLWKDGSKEARRAVKGQIIEVNRKYGFAVVDLGSKSVVKQALSNNKTNEAKPNIPKNCEMLVARNMDSGDGEFIGKIKLVKIHENCSIANVIKPINKNLRIGDVVYFSDEQIAAMADSDKE